MKLYAFPEKKGWKIFLFLFLFGLLQLSRDTLVAQNIVGVIPSQFLTAVLAVIAGVIFLLVNRKQFREILKDPRMAVALAAAVFILVPMLVKRDFQLMYLSFLFYVLVSLFLSFFLTPETLSKYYLLILTPLAAYSVIAAYGLRILPDRGILQFPVFVNPTGVEFYQMGLAQVPLTFVKNRNFGIFREPGVYQFFLILGLYLNNETVNWEKSWQTWTVNVILGITMLTTFATGGIIEMGLLAVYLFFEKKWYRSSWGKIGAAALILAVGGAAAWILITKNSLYADLTYMFAKFRDPENGVIRFAAIAKDIEIFFHHPLVGDTMEKVFGVVVSNSTSTMVLFATLGILGGCFHTAGWVALVWDRKRSIFGNLLLLLILFMSFNTQNLSWNTVFWMLPTVALVHRGLPLILGRTDPKEA